MRVRRLHGWLGVALACVLIAPAVAAASGARVIAPDVCDAEECNGYPSSGAVVEYEAAAGEPNALELSFGDGVAMLRDPGAAVSVGQSCASVSVHEAACRLDEAATAGIPPRVAVRLGDLDDTLRIVGAFPLRTRIDAGPGNDVVSGSPDSDELIAGPGDDQLNGGAGNDRLIGDAGRDSLLGGGGNDTLVATEPNAATDLFDGGEGRDAVSFEDARVAVVATLEKGGAGGTPGEADVFADVEDLLGGAGDDRLTGDAGPNALFGNDGSDQLAGGPGADTLDGGRGADEIRAGSGNDTISGTIGARQGDRVFCGSGVDTITSVQPADVLAPDCERVDMGVSVVGDTTMRPHPVAVRDGLASFAIPCRSRRGCRGSVRLRRAAARHGGPQRRFSTRHRGRITVAVPLPRRGTLVRVSVSFVRRGDGEQGHVRYTVRIPR